MRTKAFEAGTLSMRSATKLFIGEYYRPTNGCVIVYDYAIVLFPLHHLVDVQ